MRSRAEHVGLGLQLQAPAAVDEVEEGHLALAAAGVQAAGDAVAVLGLGAVGQVRVRRVDGGDRPHAGEGVGERVDAVGAQPLELGPADGEQLRLLGHRSRRRRSW